MIVKQRSLRVARRRSASSLQPLRVIGSLTTVYTTEDVTTAGNEQRRSRLPQYLGGTADVTEAWLLYMGYWCNIGAGGRVTNNSNSYPISAYLEVGSAVAAAPNATLASPASVAPGTNFLAGPFTPAQFSLATIPAAAQVFDRSNAIVTVGQALPRQGRYASQAPAYRRVMDAAQSTAELTTVGAMSAGTDGNSVGAAGLIGRTAVWAPSWVVYHNSIGANDGDTQQYPAAAANAGGGHVQRAFANVGGKQIANLRLGRSGETLQGLMTYGQPLFDLAIYGEFALLVLGANDLFDTNPTAMTSRTAYINYMTTLFSILRGKGVRRIAVEGITPRTSGDYTTVAGQTIATNWDYVSVDYINNTWLPARLADGTIDAYVRTDLDASDPSDRTKWKASGTGDGTHPSAAMAATMAATLATTIAAVNAS